MRRYSKRKEKFSAPQALGLKQSDAMRRSMYRQQMIHINCDGAIEIENSEGIIDYDVHHVKLSMGNTCVVIEGDELVMDTYQKNHIVVHGRIFALRFCYERVQPLV